MPVHFGYGTDPQSLLVIAWQRYCSVILSLNLMQRIRWVFLFCFVLFVSFSSRVESLEFLNMLLKIFIKRVCSTFPKQQMALAEQQCSVIELPLQRMQWFIALSLSLWSNRTIWECRIQIKFTLAGLSHSVCPKSFLPTAAMKGASTCERGHYIQISYFCVHRHGCINKLKGMWKSRDVSFMVLWKHMFSIENHFVQEVLLVPY